MARVAETMKERLGKEKRRENEERRDKYTSAPRGNHRERQQANKGGAGGGGRVECMCMFGLIFASGCRVI